MHVHVRTSFFHCSYSLYEPKDIVLSEYKSGLEKAILKNSTLLVQLNDAFCKTHPWLAQKVCTRSAHAAVSKVCADAVLKKVLNVRRKKAGEFLKDVRSINAIKLEDSHLLEGVRYHTAGSEPFFYDASYNHTRQLGAIPVDLNGRCIAVLITTAEAFDNILFVLLHVQERAYYYACVYTSDWNGSQTSILVVQCNWHHLFQMSL